MLPGSELILQALLCVFSIVGYWQCFVSGPLPGLTHAWVCRARFLSTALLILFPDQVYDGDFLSMIPGSARLCNFLFGTLLLSDTGVIARLKLSVLFCSGGKILAVLGLIAVGRFGLLPVSGNLFIYTANLSCSRKFVHRFIYTPFFWQNGNYSY